MTNKGTYTNFDGKKLEYTYDTTMTLSQKVNFVMEVAGMVVSKEIGYAVIMKNAFFNYCLVKYLTNIDLFGDNFDLDLLDEFLTMNKETVVNVISDKLENGLYNELSNAVDEAIEFRKMHFSDYRDDIDTLLQVVREFVVKPDYMNELLQALTNKVNSFADNGDIDMDAVNQFVNIIPILQQADNKDVAKAIVTEFHNKDEKKDNSNKSKSNRGRKPKSKQSENIDIKPVK